MPLYMTQFAYIPEAWAALTRSPEDRSEAVRRLLENMGGRLVSFYNIGAIKTTTLLSVEDAMEAMRKAGQATFQGPRQR